MGQVSTDYDVDKMWIGVKNAITEEGVPCGNEQNESLRNPLSLDSG